MVCRLAVLVLVVAAVGVVTISGCSDSSDGVAALIVADHQPSTQAKQSSEEHGHKPGAHGGIVVEIGRDNYHVEAVFEKEGVLRLFTLGKDEARVQEVESQELQAYVKSEGAVEAIPIAFTSQPQAGDAPGKTSHFIATLPQDLQGKRLEVTVPSIRMGGERFRFAFRSFTETHEDGMPAGVDEAEAKKLYLTPGGIYTAADIKANGSVTAGDKFRGIKSKHDMRPKAGDKICPVTLTKANPQFTWVVGGKSYEFCCPPCVDEFVHMAKTQPDDIKEPADYVKRK